MTMTDVLFLYRFSTKSGVHNLPPMITRFPSTSYHPPPYSGSSETHFIRTPIPISTPANPIQRPVNTHTFNPFLDISHRLRLVVHFSSNNTEIQQAEPVSMEFAIIVTDYPAGETANLNTDLGVVLPAGDEAVNIDLDLPEYTPRYEE